MRYLDGWCRSYLARVRSGVPPRHFFNYQSVICRSRRQRFRFRAWFYSRVRRRRKSVGHYALRPIDPHKSDIFHCNHNQNHLQRLRLFAAVYILYWIQITIIAYMRAWVCHIQRVMQCIVKVQYKSLNGWDIIAMVKINTKDEYSRKPFVVHYKH